MISLEKGLVTAKINPQGAWVEELVLGSSDIFFPKTDLLSDSGARKTRGGMHVCLPNFGPGGDSDLDQHGFGRTSSWKTISQNSASVTLQLHGLPPRYEGLVCTLLYTLHDNGIEAVLTLGNTSSTSVRVAPGFHPYFALGESEAAVSVNDQVYELGEIGEANFISAQQVSLKTASRQISLQQTNLSTWAIWTDSLAGYVCVEPTFGGNRFLEPSSPEEHLAPNTEKTFSCNISW